MKKIIALVIGTLACAAMAFALPACGSSNFDTITEAYESVAEATKVVSTITVERGDSLLNSREESYEKTESGYSLVIRTTVRNEIGSGDGMFTVTESEPQTVSESDVSFGELPSESSFSDITYTESDGGLTMTATVPASVLDLGSEDVTGDIACTIEVSGDNFMSLTMEYSTPDGNIVTIAYIYSY